MNTKIEALLSKEYACTSEELNGRETIFSIRADTKRPFIKILAYRHCVVVCTSEELHEKIRGILKGKSWALNGDFFLKRKSYRCGG